MDRKKIIFLEVLLLLGVTILFYPDLSDYINSISQSRAVLNHGKSIENYDKDKLEEILLAAKDYNKKIAAELNPLYYPDKIPAYDETLNPFNNGMMASITIEKINVELPIYHGMNEGIIQKNAGHIKGTSLPIGGESTHCVISTHRGLPSARLFTDLNKLEIGDEFTISVLDKELTYRVDQIVTVLPTQVEELRIEDHKDYMTLFTCTPYGVNSHRLLVRGARIEGESDEKDKTGEERKEKNNRRQMVKMIVILIIIFIILVSIIRNIVILLKKEKVE